MADLFRQRPNSSFEDVGDEMQGAKLIGAAQENRVRGQMRNKLVHQQGIVAKARFEASSDKYTGIFKGADNVLIRLSDADLIVPDVSSNPNPSVALKFLRDGKSSANQFGMVSFEGSNSWDFFG